MKNISQNIKLFIFIFLMLKMQWVFGQPASYSFTNFNSRNGMASSEVYSVFQDAQHYLWVGHALGISRYDGYQFENFLEAGSQPLLETYCITEDAQQRIWAGSAIGLFYFQQNHFTQVVFESKYLPVHDIAFDKEGGLWLCTGKGLVYLGKEKINDILSGSEIVLSDHIVPAWKKLFPMYNPVKKIDWDDMGNLFLADDYRLFRYRDQQLSVVWQGQSNKDDEILCMKATGNETIYFYAEQQRLQVIERGNIKSLPSIGGGDKVMFEAKGQVFYFDGTGAFEINSTGHFLKKIFTPPEGTDQLWSSTIYIDKENNFWIGTHRGLLQAKQKLLTTIVQSELTGFNELYCAYQLKDGRLLFGANRGRVFVKTSSGFENFLPEKKLWPSAEVMAIHEDEDGDVWFASGYQGISVWQKGVVRNFTIEDGLPSNTFFYFLSNSKNELFVCGDNNITRIIKNTKGEIQFKSCRFLPGISDFPKIKTGIIKPDGNILSGSNSGLLELNGDSLQIVYLKGYSKKNLIVTDILQDKKGFCWISTMGNGILKCVFENGKTIALEKQITMKDGLLSDNILKLLADKNNTIWAVGYDALMRIEQPGKTDFLITSLKKEDGFINEPFHTSDIIQDKEGRIWVATSSGLNTLNPEKIMKNLSAPVIQLTNAEIIDPSREKIYMSSTGNAELSHSQNSLHFSFVGLHLSNPSSVVYSYRLLNADSAWIEGGNNRDVYFRNLKPGKYTFQVRAAAGTNQWSKPVSYSFRIKYPYWQRAWFITVCTIFVFALIYWLVRKRIKIIRHEAELKQKIAETEMQALRAQMNPHFIFNALNSIDNLIQNNEKDRATSYLARFAKLIRAILENSKQELIPVWKDMETLKLYLDLELLRCDNNFVYRIDIADELLQGDYKIPPLVIQPFVENAIHHGLMNKRNAPRNLTVTAKVLDSVVSFTVEDNGIGRMQAEKLKQLNNSGYQPYGIDITRDRINLFNSNGKHESVKISDLVNDKNEPAGTKVEIQFNN